MKEGFVFEGNAYRIVRMYPVKREGYILVSTVPCFDENNFEEVDGFDFESNFYKIVKATEGISKVFRCEKKRCKS